MNKIKFSEEQIKELLANKNVVRCSNKSITYNNAFKIFAVKRYYEDDCSPQMIFLEAGFNLNVIGRKHPKECLRRWREIYNQKGDSGLAKETRGRGRPRKNREDDIEYLKIKIAYLEKENSFLAKLRGLKRE